MRRGAQCTVCFHSLHPGVLGSVAKHKDSMGLMQLKPPRRNLLGEGERKHKSH